MKSPSQGVIQQLTFSVLSTSVPENDEVMPDTITAIAASPDILPTMPSIFTKCAKRITGSFGKFPSHAANKELPSVGEEGPTTEGRGSSTTSSTPVRSPIQSQITHLTPHYENLTVETAVEPTIEEETMEISSIDRDEKRRIDDSQSRQVTPKVSSMDLTQYHFTLAYRFKFLE